MLQAEDAAHEACFLVQHVAQSMWAPVCGRTKDYVSAPKANGYASIHITLCLQPVCAAAAEDLECMPAELARATASFSFDADDCNDTGTPPTALSAPYMELQIRTQVGLANTYQGKSCLSSVYSCLLTGSQTVLYVGSIETLLMPGAFQ